MVVWGGQWNGIVAFGSDGIRTCTDFGVGRDVSGHHYGVHRWLWTDCVRDEVFLFVGPLLAYNCVTALLADALRTPKSKWNDKFAGLISSEGE